MPKKPFSRRDFLKTTAAGSILGSTASFLSPQKLQAEGGSPTLLAKPGLSTMGELGKPVPPPPASHIFRSDLSQCEPANRLTREFIPGKWVLIDYETQGGLKGTMINAYPEADSGELVLPLEVKGKHRIYLGINYTKAPYNPSNYGDIEVKLTKDAGFRRVAMENITRDDTGRRKIGYDSNHIHKSIQEPYWKTADLTGQSLIIRQPIDPYGHPEFNNLSNLCYVKLVPLADEEIAPWEVSESRQTTRNVAVIYCTAHMTGHTSGTETFHPTSKDWVRHEMTPYLNSDIGLFIFEAMRGNYCLFPTEYGDVGNESNTWQPEWINPLATYTDIAHEHGLKIFAALRMISTQYPMNRAPIGRARYYWELREFAKIDRNGVPTSNLSLAYPEVRQHWLNLLREALDYPIDGIQLHLNRANPFVLYEKPVVDAFMEEYGEDPRQLSEFDPRWQEHAAAYLTDFLREVRELLDEKSGRELGITVYGHPHDYDSYRENYHPLRYGCDVETWIQEDIVNYLMPNKYIDHAMLRRWREIGGSKIHLYPDLMPRQQLPKAYAALAKGYYENGADGVVAWDGERRAPRISEWAAFSQLGDPDRLDHIIRANDQYYGRIPLKILGGFSTEHSFHDG